MEYITVPKVTFFWAGLLFCLFVVLSICTVIVTSGQYFIAAATKLIQEGSATVAGQMPTIVALNFNKPPPLSVCPQTCAVSESMSSSAQSVTSPRPGILRKRAHDATLVTQYVPCFAQLASCF